MSIDGATKVGTQVLPVPIAQSSGGTGSTTLGAGVITATGSTTARTAADIAAQFTTLEANGAAGDGTTDDTAAFNLALAQAAATRATILLGPKTYLILGQITLPNDGAVPAKMAPIRIMGSGAQWSGRGVFAAGGTVLDLRYSGTEGKIRSNGLGVLEITGVTFRDGAGTSTPFLYTTNTTLLVHGNSFVGSKSGTLCDQDAIVLGGTTEVEGGSGWNDGFQGYGTVIRENYFNGIRRAVYGRTFANGVVVRDNTIWSGSGSNLAGGAAIEFDNPAVGATQSASGNFISGNLLEVGSYPYGIKFGRAAQNLAIGNGMFDNTGTTLAAVRYESTALANWVVHGWLGGGLTGVSSATGNQNSEIQLFGLQQNAVTFKGQVVMDSTYGARSYSLLVTGALPDSGETASITVHPTADQLAATKLLDLRRSAAAGTSPNVSVLGAAYNGDITYRAAGFTNSGTTWQSYQPGGAATGSNMMIDSGTGGSYVDVKGARIRTFSNTGAAGPVIVPASKAIYFGDPASAPVILSSSGSPEGAIVAPVGSLYLRSDGGAGTSLYVKETGTGNTGWVGK